MTVTLAHLRDVENYEYQRWQAEREKAQRAVFRVEEAFQAYISSSEAHAEALLREKEAFDAWRKASDAVVLAQKAPGS